MRAPDREEKKINQKDKEKSIKKELTGEVRFVKIIKLSVEPGTPGGKDSTVKKDEKSHKNQLTETSIFDTMIKHLNERLNASEERVNPKRSASKEIEKSLKKGLTKKRGSDTI